jgi:hypothetical protein
VHPASDWATGHPLVLLSKFPCQAVFGGGYTPPPPPSLTNPLTKPLLTMHFGCTAVPPFHCVQSPAVSVRTLCTQPLTVDPG